MTREDFQKLREKIIGLREEAEDIVAFLKHLEGAMDLDGPGEDE